MGIEIWDRIWSGDRFTSDYSLKYLEFIGEIGRDLPAGSRILEAGSGTGQTLSCFSRGHHTVGLDISVRALELSRGSCESPVRGDILSMPFRDESFDLVYNSGVIEHFKEPENLRAIREMARVTKREGMVIVIVPNSLCPWYRAWKWVATRRKKFEFGYEEDYTPGRLRRALDEAGLSVSRIFGLQALPPLATGKRELLPVAWRRAIGAFERLLPMKQYFAYTVGIVARKS
jgi:SAM-dependent methyltransferase